MYPLLIVSPGHVNCKQCLDVGVGPILMRFIMCVCFLTTI